MRSPTNKTASRGMEEIQPKIAIPLRKNAIDNMIDGIADRIPMLLDTMPEKIRENGYEENLIHELDKWCKVSYEIATEHANPAWRLVIRRGPGKGFTDLIQLSAKTSKAVLVALFGKHQDKLPPEVKADDTHIITYGDTIEVLHAGDTIATLTKLGASLPADWKMLFATPKMPPKWFASAVKLRNDVVQLIESSIKNGDYARIFDLSMAMTKSLYEIAGIEESPLTRDVFSPYEHARAGLSDDSGEGPAVEFDESGNKLSSALPPLTKQAVGISAPKGDDELVKFFRGRNWYVVYAKHADSDVPYGERHFDAGSDAWQYAQSIVDEATDVFITSYWEAQPTKDEDGTWAETNWKSGIGGHFEIQSEDGGTFAQRGEQLPIGWESDELRTATTAVPLAKRAASLPMPEIPSEYFENAGGREVIEVFVIEPEWTQKRFDSLDEAYKWAEKRVGPGQAVKIFWLRGGYYDREEDELGLKMMREEVENTKQTTGAITAVVGPLISLQWISEDGKDFELSSVWAGFREVRGWVENGKISGVSSKGPIRVWRGLDRKPTTASLIPLVKTAEETQPDLVFRVFEFSVGNLAADNKDDKQSDFHDPYQAFAYARSRVGPGQEIWVLFKFIERNSDPSKGWIERSYRSVDGGNFRDMSNPSYGDRDGLPVVPFIGDFTAQLKVGATLLPLSKKASDNPDSDDDSEPVDDNSYSRTIHLGKFMWSVQVVPSNWKTYKERDDSWELNREYETDTAAFQAANAQNGPGKEVWVRKLALMDDEENGEFWGVVEDWIARDGGEFKLNDHRSELKSEASSFPMPKIPDGMWNFHNMERVAVYILDNVNGRSVSRGLARNFETFEAAFKYADAEAGPGVSVGLWRFMGPEGRADEERLAREKRDQLLAEGKTKEANEHFVYANLAYMTWYNDDGNGWVLSDHVSSVCSLVALVSGDTVWLSRGDNVRLSATASAIIPLAKIAKRPPFEEQQFTDDDGQYRVLDILDYADEHQIPTQEIPIADLEHNLEPSSEDAKDPTGLPGAPEFVEIADKTDLQYPILVIEYPDGLWVADGVHRLWKAKQEGSKTISARLLSKDDLNKVQHEISKEAGLIPLAKIAGSSTIQIPEVQDGWMTGRLYVDVQDIEHNGPTITQHFDGLPAALEWSKNRAGPGHAIRLSISWDAIPTHEEAWHHFAELFEQRFDDEPANFLAPGHPLPFGHLLRFGWTNKRGDGWDRTEVWARDILWEFNLEGGDKLTLIPKKADPFGKPPDDSKARELFNEIQTKTAMQKQDALNELVRIHVRTPQGELQHHYLNKGEWAAPAGRLDPGDTVQSAASRELQWRTGLYAKPEDFVVISSEERPDGWVEHHVEVPFELLAKTGEPQTEIRFAASSIPLAKIAMPRPDLLTIVYITGARYDRREFHDLQTAFEWARKQVGPGMEVEVLPAFNELTENEKIINREWISTDGDDFKEMVSREKWTNTVPYLGDFSRMMRTASKSLRPPDISWTRGKGLFMVEELAPTHEVYEFDNDFDAGEAAEALYAQGKTVKMTASWIRGSMFDEKLEALANELIAQHELPDQPEWVMPRPYRCGMDLELILGPGRDQKKLEAWVGHAVFAIEGGKARFLRMKTFKALSSAEAPELVGEQLKTASIPLTSAAEPGLRTGAWVLVYEANKATKQQDRDFPDIVQAFRWARTQAGPGMKVFVGLDSAEHNPREGEPRYRSWFSKDGDDFVERTHIVHASTPANLIIPWQGDHPELMKLNALIVPLSKQAADDPETPNPSDGAPRSSMHMPNADLMKEIHKLQREIRQKEMEGQHPWVVYIRAAGKTDEKKFFDELVQALRFGRTRAGPGIRVVVSGQHREQEPNGKWPFTRNFISTDGRDFVEKRNFLTRSETPNQTFQGNHPELLKLNQFVIPLVKQGSEEPLDLGLTNIWVRVISETDLKDDTEREFDDLQLAFEWARSRIGPGMVVMVGVKLPEKMPDGSVKLREWMSTDGADFNLIPKADLSWGPAIDYQGDPGKLLKLNQANLLLTKKAGIKNLDDAPPIFAEINNKLTQIGFKLTLYPYISGGTTKGDRIVSFLEIPHKIDWDKYEEMTPEDDRRSSKEMEELLMDAFLDLGVNLKTTYNTEKAAASGALISNKVLEGTSRSGESIEVDFEAARSKSRLIVKIFLGSEMDTPKTSTASLNLPNIDSGWFPPVGEPGVYTTIFGLIHGPGDNGAKDGKFDFRDLHEALGWADHNVAPETKITIIASFEQNNANDNVVWENILDWAQDTLGLVPGETWIAKRPFAVHLNLKYINKDGTWAPPEVETSAVYLMIERRSDGSYAEANTVRHPCDPTSPPPKLFDTATPTLASVEIPLTKQAAHTMPEVNPDLLRGENTWEVYGWESQDDKYAAPHKYGIFDNPESAWAEANRHVGPGYSVWVGAYWYWKRSKEEVLAEIEKKSALDIPFRVITGTNYVIRWHSSDGGDFVQGMPQATLNTRRYVIDSGVPRVADMLGQPIDPITMERKATAEIPLTKFANKTYQLEWITAPDEEGFPNPPGPDQIGVWELVNHPRNPMLTGGNPSPYTSALGKYYSGLDYTGDDSFEEAMRKVIQDAIFGGRLGHGWNRLIQEGDMIVVNNPNGPSIRFVVDGAKVARAAVKPPLTKVANQTYQLEWLPTKAFGDRPDYGYWQLVNHPDRPTFWGSPVDHDGKPIDSEKMRDRLKTEINEQLYGALSSDKNMWRTLEEGDRIQVISPVHSGFTFHLIAPEWGRNWGVEGRNLLQIEKTAASRWDDPDDEPPPPTKAPKDPAAISQPKLPPHLLNLSIPTKSNAPPSQPKPVQDSLPKHDWVKWDPTDPLSEYRCRKCGAEKDGNLYRVPVAKTQIAEELGEPKWSNWSNDIPKCIDENKEVEVKNITVERQRFDPIDQERTIAEARASANQIIQQLKERKVLDGEIHLQTGRGIGGWYEGSVPRVSASKFSTFPRAPSVSPNTREEYENFWLNPFIKTLEEAGYTVVQTVADKINNAAVQIPLAKIASADEEKRIWNDEPTATMVEIGKIGRYGPQRVFIDLPSALRFARTQIGPGMEIAVWPSHAEKKEDGAIISREFISRDGNDFEETSYQVGDQDRKTTPYQGDQSALLRVATSNLPLSKNAGQAVPQLDLPDDFTTTDTYFAAFVFQMPELGAYITRYKKIEENHKFTSVEDAFNWARPRVGPGQVVEVIANFYTDPNLFPPDAWTNLTQEQIEQYNWGWLDGREAQQGRPIPKTADGWDARFRWVSSDGDDFVLQKRSCEKYKYVRSARMIDGAPETFWRSELFGEQIEKGEPSHRKFSSAGTASSHAITLAKTSSESDEWPPYVDKITNAVAKVGWARVNIVKNNNDVNGDYFKIDFLIDTAELRKQAPQGVQFSDWLEDITIDAFLDANIKLQSKRSNLNWGLVGQTPAGEDITANIADMFPTVHNAKLTVYLDLGHKQPDPDDKIPLNKSASKLTAYHYPADPGDLTSIAENGLLTPAALATKDLFKPVEQNYHDRVAEATKQDDKVFEPELVLEYLDHSNAELDTAVFQLGRNLIFALLQPVQKGVSEEHDQIASQTPVQINLEKVAKLPGTKFFMVEMPLVSGDGSASVDLEQISWLSGVDMLDFFEDKHAEGMLFGGVPHLAIYVSDGIIPPDCLKIEKEAAPQIPLAKSSAHNHRSYHKAASKDDTLEKLLETWHDRSAKTTLEPTDTVCPNCDEPLYYDRDTGKHVCTDCGYKETRSQIHIPLAKSASSFHMPTIPDNLYDASGYEEWLVEIMERGKERHHFQTQQEAFSFATAHQNPDNRVLIRWWLGLPNESNDPINIKQAEEAVLKAAINFSPSDDPSKVKVLTHTFTVQYGTSTRIVWESDNAGPWVLEEAEWYDRFAEGWVETTQGGLVPHITSRWFGRPHKLDR